MAQEDAPRRISLFAPILLIAIGAIFLYSNWHPDFDPWPIFGTIGRSSLSLLG